MTLKARLGISSYVDHKLLPKHPECGATVDEIVDCFGSGSFALVSVLRFYSLYNGKVVGTSSSQELQTKFESIVERSSDALLRWNNVIGF